MDQLPKTEEERKAYSFEVALGSYVLARQHDGATTLDLSSLDTDLMHYFFNSGWSWGQNEECPHCNLAPNLD